MDTTTNGRKSKVEAPIDDTCFWWSYRWYLATKDQILKFTQIIPLIDYSGNNAIFAVALL